MRPKRRALTLATLLALVPGAALAQSPAPSGPPPLGPAVLEVLCSSNATNEADLALCLDVVHRILYPGSGPAPTVAPSGYGAELPGVGATQSREDADVTLVAVDWNAKADFLKPDKGNRYVAIRVLYLGTQDGGSYNPLNWTAVDLDGFQHQTLIAGGKDPALASSNDLPAGRKAQGWVTFEVPKDVHSLEIVESQFGTDYLRWLIAEPRK